MRISRRTRRIAGWGCFAALFAFGLWISLRYTLGNWAPDSDIAFPIVILDGVKERGFGFLKTVIYTPDNWLLSLYPITSAVFSVLGTAPVVVIGTGWVIFLVSLGLTAYLAGRLSGRIAAAVTALVLVYANYWAMGGIGFLSYLVSHNISMAWGLAALALAHRAVIRRSAAWPFLAGVCVFVASVSDPWAVPTIGLPLVLSGGFIAISHRHQTEGRVGAAVALSSAAGLLAAYTKLFGVFGFLTSQGFSFAGAGDVESNAVWMFRVIGIIFDAVPTGAITSTLVLAFSAIAFFTCVLCAAAATVSRLRGSGAAERLVFSAILLSLVLVFGSFLLRAQGPGGSYMGRYLINWYFFGILLIVVSAHRLWKLIPLPAKLAAIGYGGLFIFAGVYSYIGVWNGTVPMQDSNPSERNLGAFLYQNGLTYGYGPYRGAQALAMGWITDGRVTIRPVSFLTAPNVVAGGRVQTSRLWYLPSDQPKAVKSVFLIVANDDENCPVVAACLTTANRQFGPPDESLSYQGLTVLVWRHTIASRLGH